MNVRTPKLARAVAIVVVFGVALIVSVSIRSSTAQGVLTPGGRGGITAVTAGSGLTGGASSGPATVNVGPGSGISVTADTVTIDPTYTQRRVTATCTAPESIAEISQSGGVTCTSGTGDITGVTAGSGMTGTATSGAASLDVAVTSGGGLTVAADSIGLSTACSTDQILRWDGDSWECTAVNTGSTVSCSAGSVVMSISAAGSPSCSPPTITETGDISAVTAGDGLTGGGTTGAVTVDVGAGTNIDVAANTVDLEPSVSLAGESGTNTLDVANAATGQTAAVKGVNATMTGSFDTTGGAFLNFAGYFSNSSTRSAGASAINNYGIYALGAASSGITTNYGVYAQTNGAGTNSYAVNAVSSGASTTNYAVRASATSGTTNYSFFGAAGLMSQAEDATFDDTVTINGKTGVDTLNVNNSNTGQGAGIKGVDTNLTGTSSGTFSNYAGYFSNTMTPTDAESFTQTNYGLYSTASGADGSNYSGYFDAGYFYVNGNGVFTGSQAVGSNPILSASKATADTTGRAMLGADSSGVITTAGAASVYGLTSSVANTRAGAGSLTQYAAYLDASGADTNYALYTNNGSVRFGGLVTAASGGTTTANWTTTGTGDLVSGDDLTVADDSTFTDAVSIEGNTTIGNASSDTLTVNATTTHSGPTTLARTRGKTQTINTAGGTQNDLAVAADTAIIKYTTTAGANTNLTGFAISGGNTDGDILYFTIGATIVVTVSVETTSTAANRISGQGDASDFTFRGPTTLTFIYDGTLSRWALSPIANRLPGLIVDNNSTLGDSNNDVVSIRMLKDSATAATLSSCGTSPTVTGGSTAFTITVGTGGVTACTATFASTKTNSPTCTAIERDVAEGVYLSSVSATAITITARTGTTDLSSNVIDVICIGDA